MFSFNFSPRRCNIFILPLEVPSRRADVRPYERLIRTFSFIICAGPARQRRMFPVGTSTPQRRHSYFAETQRDRTIRARNKSSVIIHSPIDPFVRTSVRTPSVFFLLHTKEYLVTRRHAHVRAHVDTRIYIYIYIYICIYHINICINLYWRCKFGLIIYHECE